MGHLPHAQLLDLGEDNDLTVDVIEFVEKCIEECFPVKQLQPGILIGVHRRLGQLCDEFLAAPPDPTPIRHGYAEADLANPRGEARPALEVIVSAINYHEHFLDCIHELRIRNAEEPKRSMDKS